MGTAFVTGFAGVSLSLGAFLAGLLVSESRFGSQALGEILPLQILFSATFFVSVGLLLDLSFLMRNLGTILAVVAVVLILKAVVTTASAKVLGISAGSSVAAGLLLAQVGEFSFVLEQAGREAGLSPAGLEGAGGQTFIAASVVLMALTPFLAQAGGALGRRLESKAAGRAAAQGGGSAATSGPVPDPDLADHVLILGYGRTGRWLARRLQRGGVPHLVVTLSPTGAAQAEEVGIRVMRGDYSKLSILLEAHLRQARLAVIADDTLEMAERTLEVIRGSRPELPVLVKISLEEDAEELRHAGAAFAVSEEDPSHRALLAELLSRLELELEDLPPEGEGEGASADNEDDQAVTYELTLDQRRSEGCSHLAQARAVSPEAVDICPECVAQGDRWMHLRVCMTCGHVGCCDSSKNRHARRHAEATGHPIVRSLEPGETWAWCFVDETIL